MSVVYDGGVILAADSRTSTGTYVANRVQEKFNCLAENVYMLRSGSVGSPGLAQLLAKSIMRITAERLHLSSSATFLGVGYAGNCSIRPTLSESAYYRHRCAVHSEGMHNGNLWVHLLSALALCWWPVALF